MLTITWKAKPRLLFHQRWTSSAPENFYRFLQTSTWLDNFKMRWRVFLLPGETQRAPTTMMDDAVCLPYKRFGCNMLLVQTLVWLQLSKLHHHWQNKQLQKSGRVSNVNSVDAHTTGQTLWLENSYMKAKMKPYTVCKLVRLWRWFQSRTTFTLRLLLLTLKTFIRFHKN